MKKRILLISSSVAILLIVATIIYKSMHHKHQFRRVNPAFKEYVEAFTSGVISTQSAIKVRLANNYADSALFNTKVKEDLFDFSPSIKGKTYWVDSRTVEFKPDEALPAKEFYEVKFYLSKVLKVPDSLKTLEFQFQTIQQDFMLKVDNHKAYKKTDLTKEKLYGTITTADFAEDMKVEKILSATQGDRTLPITWIHESKNKIHYFQVDSVQRSKVASSMVLTYDGKSIDAEKHGESSVEIPALGVFKLLDISIEQGSERYIRALFSDPLMENQNLDGLIKYANSMDIRYTIEDNELRIYPSDKKSGSYWLTIESSVKNTNGQALGQAVQKSVTIEDIKPAVKFVGSGVIMPTSNGFLLPIEAVNLKAVDVKVTQIYQNNILQFLQVNDLSGQNELARVGKTVLKKSILLNNVMDYSKWNRYYLDLSSLISVDPGAIYSVRLSFKKSYSTYPCTDTTASDDKDMELTTWNNANDDEEGWYYENNYYNYYYDEDGYYYYDWNERDNPCSPSYYNNTAITNNVLASDLGIIVKGGSDKSMNVYVTDIVSTKPMDNVTVEFYDYQQQLLGNAITNSDGMAEVKLKKKPFVLVAKKDKQRGYVKLVEGASMSLSMFDVGGESVKKGIKGFIYGERGVWRPGDSLYLTFILEDKEKTLPENIPVSMDLIGPNGLIAHHLVRTSSVNGFYDFRTCTERNAPTGNWQAKVKVSGIEFTKSLKIETIKPNRLKINLKFPKEYIAKGSPDKGALEAHWLTGAASPNLKATVNLTLTRTETTFKKYPAYIFDNPSASFSTENISIFDGQLDNTGKATITPDINISSSAAGMLKANFETTVYEAGGDFSVDNTQIPYYPYETYAGLYVPENPTKDKMLYTDQAYNISLVNLDYNGAVVPSNKLKVEVFKQEWRWWWDNSESSSQAQFISTSYSKLVDSSTVSTLNGKASYTFKVAHDDWGRYFIKVTDKKSGHAAGKVIYADWYGYKRGPGSDKTAATMLNFSSDKEKYSVGDRVKITIPTSADGRALLTLETGTKVLKSVWIPTEQGTTAFSFEVTADMAPNCYAYVTLIQPHSQTLNDLPMRLYGVIPIMVEDPGTHLVPQIAMQDVLLPEQNAYIAVNEKNGKPMTYTLAIVDEGLLDLTHYKTPDPWSSFYAKEALGVISWDIFDLVLGAFTGDLQRILSIGGDMEGIDKGNLKANRFKPMVRFIGPFQLPAGGYKVHTISMPQYIGSVRVMVVAGDNGKYGFAEKTVAVRKPLMVLGTVPRVIGPGESFQLPVSVFAMEKYINNVSVQLVPDNMFTNAGASVKSLVFNAPGDAVVNFDLKVKDAVGVGKIKIIATCGSEVAVHDIEIDVRNANPKVVNVIDTVINPGKTWSANYSLIGVEGSNKGTVEVSSFPAMNLEKRLSYLIEYPHGCIEQTTSAGFPQLYLSDLIDMNATTKAKIEKNIKATIQSLKAFQLSNGGLSYWPGAQYADDWGTNYAGHFMLEAELKGYALPVGFIKAWKKYQKQKAISWSANSSYYNDDLDQAYRLYTLALAKEPELGAMNELFEYKDLSLAARWRLAAAYLISGKPEVAKYLIANAGIAIKSYREMWNTYGSDERDKAMIIETLTLMNYKTKAAPLVKAVSASLCNDEWMSTQTTAYCLIALTKYFLTSSGSGVYMTCNIDGKPTTVSSSKSFSKIDMGITALSKKGNVSITNNGQNILFARIVTQGVPVTGDKSSAQNKLKLKVEYKALNGAKVDPKKLEQGSSFIAEVTVSNPGSYEVYKQLALVQIFPSGWEISNSRLSDYAQTATVASDFDYQDIRDDRVYTYFSLNPNKSKTFKILLNSSYIGKFYLPTLYCEAMYDNSINARIPGSWVEIVSAGK
jgi:uncharacterized protein YfaS (alpha-2-macroglobulin family)